MKHSSYIERAEKAVSLMLVSHQWDGLNQSTVNRWISNFDDPLRYYAWKILRHLLYYSEVDIELLLREVLFHNIIGHDVPLRTQVSSAFHSYPCELAWQFAQELPKTLLVPLMDSSSPSESGPALTRVAMQKLLYPKTSIVFPDKILCSRLENGDFRRVVIIDDNSGTGDQFRKFWTTTRFMDNSDLLSDVLPQLSIPIYYAVLIMPEATRRDLQAEIPNVTFKAAQVLTAEDEVFAAASRYWENDDELHKARVDMESHLNKFGIPLLGYRDHSFAVTLHHTIPDWSLPMLWRGVNGWNPLIARKNTNA